MWAVPFRNLKHLAEGETTALSHHTFIPQERSMSLRGRYLIDRVKRSVGKYFKLPVPPYQNPSYWEGAYRQLGPKDVYEWGNISYEDVQRYDYTLLERPSDDLTTTVRWEGDDSNPISTTFAETIGVNDPSSERPNEDSILMLGCGNSNLGEEILDAGWWKGKMFQVDVSSRVIESMRQRYPRHQVEGNMQFVQDDATVLSAFNDNKITAVIDKGLVDALFCADSFDQCYSIMGSVHRVLRPNRRFCVFSFSQPDFLLQQLLLPPSDQPNQPRLRQKALSMWSDVQVRQLETILIYQFTKGDPRQMRPRQPRGGSRKKGRR